MREQIQSRTRAAWRFFAVLAALLVFLPSAAFADGWWQKDWSYRRQITIDTTPKGANVAQPVGRTAVLIRLHAGNFSFSDAEDSGNDLRFIAGDDKTPLAFHIETYDATAGIATVWIDMPDYPAGGTRNIWMYYGNKNAPAGGNSAATFDPDYALVYHFDGAAQMAPRDKTAYGNTAQNAAAGSETGVIGRAAHFAGNAPVTIASSASLNVAAGGQFTFSAWVKMDKAAPRAVVLSRRDGEGSLVIGLDQGVPFVEVSGAAPLKAPQAIAQGQWNHLAVTADGTKLTIFVNGQSVASGDGALPALASNLALGADTDSTKGSSGFAGALDEVRISRVARSALLIYSDVVGEGPESKLVVFGADEKQAGFGFGYFGIIVQNVTLDAWVVIGLLGIMALLSWLVMWNKANYVSGVSRANDAFLDIFRRSGGDPGAISEAVAKGRGRRMAQSSIYRIYRAGADEVERRSHESRGPLVLHAEAIEVIRALMDARLVRENQSLARNMVLLTIAISGGPFLGLLGTVVGVMITFAAIAASGDVNINAIAPGISAALLATVAGLAVAIPALFGYNYLVVRNKNVIADQQVFVDEFVTRLSELYRERSLARAAE